MVPASSSARPLNAAVPDSTSRATQTAAPGPACGRQPSARPTPTRRTTCANSTATTVTVFAPISPLRDSGVAPSRLSTPYRRSNPVAMA